MLEAESLRVIYGEHVALDDASLSVGSGEIVAVVGRSGSGKSTLLHCLAGITRPSAGRISLGDIRVDTATDDELSELRRSRFGFVFQFGELVPELSLLENVSLPLRFAGVSRREARRRSEAVLVELGIGYSLALVRGVPPDEVLRIMVSRRPTGFDKERYKKRRVLEYATSRVKNH